MGVYNDDLKSPGMRLRELKISQHTYGPKQGTYSGDITFDGKAGTVSVSLNDEQCAKMFAVIADGVIGAAKEVAELLVEEAKATLANSAQLVIK